MSRPNKNGLDYFPLDVMPDDKIELIEAKHGITGFAIVIKMFQRIYSQGYYCNWREEEQLLFAKKINVDINLINVVINDCLRWHLFDKCLHEQYQILTSAGIQKRFLEAIKRRKEAEIISEYLLIDINDYINSINVNINLKNVDNNKQSKVKKSKEYKEEDKEEKKQDNKIPYDDIKNLYLTNCLLLPKIQELTDKRKSAINARWNKYHDITVFETLFKKANLSSFLTGNNDNNWIATFDWLLNENNMIKVLEGNYDNKVKTEGGKKIEKL